MQGTIVNSLAIIVGSLFGLILNKGIKASYRATIMNALGLTVVVIGLSSAIESKNIILVISSLVMGSVVGEMIDIEAKLNKLGMWLQNKVGGDNGNFSNAFVTASLIFVIGAMSIVGALESGIQGIHKTLYAKSMLDGISSVIFASTLGVGVLFSSVSVFVYQGSIVLLSGVVGNLFTPDLINEMSAIGGILIMAIGLNVLELKKIKIGNMLPSIFIPMIYFLIINLPNFIK